MTFRDVICKKIAILGMARSGLAAAKLLKRHGAKVFLSDIKPEEELVGPICQLKKLGVEFETAGHTEKVVEDKDLIVLSPGVPSDLPLLREAQKRGIPIVSEVQIAGWFCEAHLVGITGSNGKTTTVSLIGEILKNAGKEVAVCGNIGRAFSEVTTTVSQDGYIVLELSSFQLERTDNLRLEVAAILNLSPDHLDRHADMNSYKKAKFGIFEKQTEGDVAILNADDLKLCIPGEVISPRAEVKLQQGVRTLLFSTHTEVEQGAWVHGNQIVFRIAGRPEAVIPVEQIGIKGPHNLANACAACCVAASIGIDTKVLRESLASFGGVEHRLEKVFERGGVTVVNDSKATNVDAVWYALQSVSPPVVLLMGGKDKGGDFTRLRQLVRENVKGLILLGQAADRIKKALGDCVPTIIAADMEEAVRLSRELACQGDTVLLSPGGSSFDMFENYEHRGEVFKKLCGEVFLSGGGSLKEKEEKSR